MAASNPTTTANTRGLVLKAARVRWRVEVMSTPDGAAWLLAQCRRLKFKEQKCGPQVLKFPEVR